MGNKLKLFFSLLSVRYSDYGATVSESHMASKNSNQANTPEPANKHKQANTN
jgi:hypothetical protein